MKLLKPKQETEEKMLNLGFNIHKFNNRPKPDDSRRILIISCFSEFGCETLSTLYCLPRLLQEHPGYYTIVMGWYGRSYLYKHLVDEFWELKEEFQHLRDYAKAFHNESKNLEKLEENCKQFGFVYGCANLAKDAIYNQCRPCDTSWLIGEGDEGVCPKCGNLDYTKALFADIPFWKRFAIPLPRPSKEKFQAIEKFVQPNMVGVCARGRKTYGRNLQPEFYVELIKLLRSMGYNPIWFGEKQSTLPCPVDDVVDFSRMPDSGDLEKTLAIVCNCKFTVQFWTASTRLAGMMGVPYLLFESPDQIFGGGQEGFRRNMCDFGPRKLCISHYLNVYNDNAAGINMVEKCIREMESENWDDVMGLLESQEIVEALRSENLVRIGGL